MTRARGHEIGARNFRRRQHVGLQLCDSRHEHGCSTSAQPAWLRRCVSQGAILAQMPSECLHFCRSVRPNRRRGSRGGPGTAGRRARPLRPTLRRATLDIYIILGHNTNAYTHMCSPLPRPLLPGSCLRYKSYIAAENSKISERRTAVRELGRCSLARVLSVR
jgi:hypothetical protein